jgi:uncharacterized protein YkwD
MSPASPRRRPLLLATMALVMTTVPAWRAVGLAARPAAAAPIRVVVHRAPASDDLVGRMLALLNRTRVDHGLHVLRLNRPLSDDALRHSQRMVRRGRLFPTPDMAAIMDPYGATIWAENLAKGRTLGRIRDGWVANASTRVHLLNPQMSFAAIGIVRADRRLWVTLYLHD